jgi:hypothetical protein
MPLLIDKAHPNLPTGTDEFPPKQSLPHHRNTADHKSRPQRRALHFTRPPINNDEVEYDNKFKGDY